MWGGGEKNTPRVLVVGDNQHHYQSAAFIYWMRVLSLLLALPSAAGSAGPELLSRLGPERGVAPAPSRRRAHVVVRAEARWAAPTIGESQQQLHAVQRNASCLSGAARPREDPCDDAEWWDRGAQSARSRVAKSVWLARRASAFCPIWARPDCAQYYRCASGRPRCGVPRVAWVAPVARSLVNTAARACRGCCATSEVHGRAIDRVPAPNFDHRLPSVIITGGRSFSETGEIGAAVTAGEPSFVDR